MIDSRCNFYKFWTRKAYKFRDILEKKLRIFEYVEPEKAAPVLQRFSEMLLNYRDENSDTVPVLSGDLIRTLYVKLFFKVLGILTGIILSVTIKIDLIAFWNDGIYSDNIRFFHYIITGIVIGLGSGVTHKVIRVIEIKREKRSQKGENI
jgi:hypothetical protein